MGKSVESLGVRVLLFQVLAHALIFATQNVGNLAERALLASDTAASVALGLSGTAFCLLSAFTTNLVNVGQHAAGRRTGDHDVRGARATARQALVLAGGGGALGLVLAVAAGAAAVFATGPARHAALFLAAQGLALGPSLGTAALTGYFAATMRVGPGLLAAVSALPVAIHLALAWLLTGMLAWSVAGAGVARLGAALAVAAAVLAIARTEFRDIVGSVRQSDRALLRTMVTEGSVLGLQQVVACLMVLLLYLRAASVDAVASTALTMTLSGVYPLLFAFAWGSSQAVGAAAALAVGRGNARELARVTWMGLGLAAGLAFALPWGAYALFGRAALPWLVESSPTGSAVLAVSVRLMDTLAIFFVFDFAINYLSALLRAAKEQVYLLKVTAAVAAGFGFLVLALPLPPDVVYLLGAFITTQAVWALLLLVRVITRWPSIARRNLPAASPPWRPALATPGPQSRPRAVTATVERPTLGHRCGREDTSAKAPGDREIKCKQPVDRLLNRANRAAGQGGGDIQGVGDDSPGLCSAEIGKAKRPHSGAPDDEFSRSNHRPAAARSACPGNGPRC
jgi:Na+-driven multidrug efflux pump